VQKAAEDPIKERRQKEKETGSLTLERKQNVQNKRRKECKK
jgi:hypothetical protein